MFSTARSAANVAGRSGGSSNWRVERTLYLTLSAAWKLSSDSEKRGIVTRSSPSPTASSALGSSGTCSPVGSGRRAGLQRAGSRSGPPSSSYVTKPSPSAAEPCVSGVIGSAPQAARRKPRLHVQRRRRTHRPERAEGHAEEPMVHQRGRLSLELAVEHTHRRLERKRHLPPRRLQLAPHAQRAVAGARHVVRREADVWVRLDVEEGARAEMRVAPSVSGVDAPGVDDQLDRPLVRADRVGAVKPREVPDDGGEPPVVPHPELDRRSRRVDDPSPRRRCRPLLAQNAHLSPLVEWVQQDYERQAGEGPTQGGGAADLFDAALQKAALGFGSRQLQRSLECCPRLVESVGPTQEFPAGRVEVLVAVEVEPLEEREPCRRP